MEKKKNQQEGICFKIFVSQVRDSDAGDFAKDRKVQAKPDS